MMWEDEEGMFQTALLLRETQKSVPKTERKKKKKEETESCAQDAAEAATQEKL